MWAEMKQWLGRPSQRLFLPVGRDVRLQNLSLSAGHRHHVYDSLFNLQDATQLTAIEFNSKFPVNLLENGWPLSMPCLNTVKLGGLPVSPPQELVKYAQLRHLDIQVSETIWTLPTWFFSQLTQLATLRIGCTGGLSGFPGCLLQLPQLSSLDVRCVHGGDDCIELPAEILQFSEFTALTNIHLKWSHKTAGGPSAFSSRTLQQLDNLRGLLLPAIVHY